MPTIHPSALQRDEREQPFATFRDCEAPTALHDARFPQEENDVGGYRMTFDVRHGHDMTTLSRRWTGDLNARGLASRQRHCSVNRPSISLQEPRPSGSRLITVPVRGHIRSHHRNPPLALPAPPAPPAFLGHKACPRCTAGCRPRESRPPVQRCGSCTMSGNLTPRVQNSLRAEQRSHRLHHSRPRGEGFTIGSPRMRSAGRRFWPRLMPGSTRP